MCVQELAPYETCAELRELKSTYRVCIIDMNDLRSIRRLRKPRVDRFDLFGLKSPSTRRPADITVEVSSQQVPGGNVGSAHAAAIFATW